MSNACGARSPDGSWRCSFLPPHGPRHSWDSVTPAVLLRDTPEDLERLAAAMPNVMDQETTDYIYERGTNPLDVPYEWYQTPHAMADAIIAALRGEK